MSPFDRNHLSAEGLRTDHEGKENEIDITNLEVSQIFYSYRITTDISQEAERLKQEGNDHFRSKAWEEALAHYKSALGYLPRRKREPTREPAEPPEPSDPGVEMTPETLPATPAQPGNESPEIIKARAVLNANVGACYMQLVGKLLYAAVPRIYIPPVAGGTQIGRRSMHGRW